MLGYKSAVTTQIAANAGVPWQRYAAGSHTRQR
jgi:hypothetical protein